MHPIPQSSQNTYVMNLQTQVPDISPPPSLRITRPPSSASDSTLPPNRPPRKKVQSHAAAIGRSTHPIGRNTLTRYRLAPINSRPQMACLPKPGDRAGDERTGAGRGRRPHGDMARIYHVYQRRTAKNGEFDTAVDMRNEVDTLPTYLPRHSRHEHESTTRHKTANTRRSVSIYLFSPSQVGPNLARRHTPSSVVPTTTNTDPVNSARWRRSNAGIRTRPRVIQRYFYGH